tara:strand:+ start:9127 stop:9873 length:747 start_codon:yes stop_codon:yes gene_type:complete
MTPNESSTRRQAKVPGRLSRSLLRLLMKPATVTASERLSDRFRMITLEGEALKGAAWTPGDKVQIAMGSAFVARTYKPIEWDAHTGRTRIIAYDHGDGPGATWVRETGPGDECHIFGPRASLDPRPLTGSLALFGDETTMGLASALRGLEPTRRVFCYFELVEGEEGAAVLTRLGLESAARFVRRQDERHLDEMEATLPALVAGGASVLLTGRAGAVQRWRQALKRHALPPGRLLSKAYWAAGKTGLD